MLPQLRQHLQAAFKQALSKSVSLLQYTGADLHVLPGLQDAVGGLISYMESPLSQTRTPVYAGLDMQQQSLPLTDVTAASQPSIQQQQQQQPHAVQAGPNVAAMQSFADDASASEALELDDIRRHNLERIQQARDEFGSGWSSQSDAYCRHFIRFVRSKHSPATNAATTEERLRRADDALALKVITASIILQCLTT